MDYLRSENQMTDEQHYQFYLNYEGGGDDDYLMTKDEFMEYLNRNEYE